jgi:transposase
MARRTKYTPETVKKITDAIRLGAAYEDACNYAGISPDTLTRWRDQYADFAEQIKKAEGAATVGWLTKIEDAATNGNWQAAAWKLERRYPDRYGRKDRVDITMTVRQEVERLVAAGVIEPDEVEAAVAEAEAIVRGRG